jgi:glucose uptake protein GlcU
MYWNLPRTDPVARASVGGSLAGIVTLLIWPHSAVSILAPFWLIFIVLGVGMIIYDYAGKGNPSTRLQRYAFFILFLTALGIASSINSSCTRFGGSWKLSLNGIHHYEVCEGFDWSELESALRS